MKRYVTKADLEKAEMNAVTGGWVEKELYQRLKATYNTERKLSKLKKKRRK